MEGPNTTDNTKQKEERFSPREFSILTERLRRSCQIERKDTEHLSMFAWSVGKTEKQEENEDVFFLGEKSLVVLDGAGGHARAREASKTAGGIISALLERPLDTLSLPLSISFDNTDESPTNAGDTLSSIEGHMKAAFEKGNEKVKEISKEVGTTVGTTATAALAFPMKNGNMLIAIAHCGDSRADIFSSDTKVLIQATTDHDVIREIIHTRYDRKKDVSDEDMTILPETAVSGGQTGNSLDIIQALDLQARKLQEKMSRQDTKEKLAEFASREFDKTELEKIRTSGTAVMNLLHGGDQLYIDVDFFEVPKGSRILLASDGITDNMNRLLMEKIARGAQRPKDAAAEILFFARKHVEDDQWKGKRGGKNNPPRELGDPKADDMTILVAEIK